jgi:hypothetical protein
MANFTAYAEVLTPEHSQYKMYAAGIKKNPPGRLLRDVLAQTRGVYEIGLPLPAEMRDNMRRVAELSGDSELLRIANLSKVPVSLEHLRGLDPETTRIVLGHMINFTEDESRQLGLGHKGPYDPKNTIRE